MNKKTEENILLEREKIIKACCERWNEPYILDSFLTGAKDVNPLVCLGHALTILSKADVAVFSHNWETARGCQIEYECCEKYGIPIFYCDTINEVYQIIDKIKSTTPTYG